MLKSIPMPNDDNCANIDIASVGIDAKKACRKGDVLANNDCPGMFMLYLDIRGNGIIENDERCQDDADTLLWSIVKLAVSSSLDAVIIYYKSMAW